MDSYLISCRDILEENKKRPDQKAAWRLACEFPRKYWYLEDGQ